MKKTKMIVSFALSSLFVLGIGGIGLNNPSIPQVSAEEIQIDGEDIQNSNEDVSTRGIYTSLSLSINGGDGKIWVTAKNDITIFPATVFVIVELYSSNTYYESHTDMELVCRNSTTDLNMGDTVVAEGITGGVQKYWQGRMRYKVDNGSWKEETTGTLLYSADGTFLGIV